MKENDWKKQKSLKLNNVRTDLLEILGNAEEKEKII
jgi:hypothetical protein